MAKQIGKGLVMTDVWGINHKRKENCPQVTSSIDRLRPETHCLEAVIKENLSSGVSTAKLIG